MNLLKSQCLLVLGFCFMGLVPAPSIAQQTTSPQPELRRIALKSGESVDLDTIYYVFQCKSVMTAPAQIEVLEGPPEISLKIREEEVVPRRLGCTKKVAGGMIVVTASQVGETKIARLMYRVKYKTKDGDRQTANAYMVGLVP